MERKEAADKRCLACSFPFWDKLTEAQQDYLCRFARPVHYDKGAHVHSPTENCVGILLLRAGQLRAYLLSEDGRDVTLYRLFAGDVCILSAPACWTPSPSTSTSTPRNRWKPTASARALSSG